MFHSSGFHEFQIQLNQTSSQANETSNRSRECRAIVLNCSGNEETQAVSRCEQLRTIALHSSTTGPTNKTRERLPKRKELLLGHNRAGKLVTIKKPAHPVTKILPKKLSLNYPGRLLSSDRFPTPILPQQFKVVWAGRRRALVMLDGQFQNH